MKCEDFELAMIDYTDNMQDQDRLAEIERHLASCERCRDEFREYETIFKSISESGMEQPDETLRLNFDHMLRSEINKLGTGRGLSITDQGVKHRYSLALKIAAGIALLLMGNFLGNIVQEKLTTRDSEAQMDSRGTEDKNRNELLLFALQNEASPGERIKAISIAESSRLPDMKVLHALIRVLNEDDNVNVRLAAAYTLSGFSDLPTVRDSIVESLGRQTEPIIQIALMNILMEKMEIKAVVPMKKIISDKNTLEQVKYAAEKSIEVLL